MDKLTAIILCVAIVCTTGIALLAMKLLTGANPAGKEVAIFTVGAIFSAISGGGVGYAIGSTKGGTDEPKT